MPGELQRVTDATEAPKTRKPKGLEAGDIMT